MSGVISPGMSRSSSCIWIISRFSVGWGLTFGRTSLRSTIRGSVHGWSRRISTPARIAHRSLWQWFPLARTPSGSGQSLYTKSPSSLPLSRPDLSPIPSPASGRSKRPQPEPRCQRPRRKSQVLPKGEAGINICLLDRRQPHRSLLDWLFSDIQRGFFLFPASVLSKCVKN